MTGFAPSPLVFIHRWLGVALGLIFLTWFVSGIGMMYWDFPDVSDADRVRHSPVLDPAAVRVSPVEALRILGWTGAVTGARLNTFDGRPVYRFRAGPGKTQAETIVYADTGAPRGDVSKEMLLRIASAWVGQAARLATVERVEEVDQWTVQGQFRNLRPLWKYSWPDGEQVYVSQASGEVVQYTTSASRIGAYAGPIPHWLYFTPLRRHGPQWTAFVIWSSGLGTVAAILGIIIGIWVYSPSKRYRYDGAPASIPYRGQKRWHTVFGLVFGLGATTWAFSGMLSMDPFPVKASPHRGSDSTEDDVGGAERVARALRGQVQIAAFETSPPREALVRAGSLKVKELELTSIAGEPVYLALLGRSETRIIPLDGDMRDEFDRQRLVDWVTKAAGPANLAGIGVLERYDRYYLDRRRERPLPVILARLNDAEHTRYYIDPKTARVVGTYSSRNWMTRWLYHGLHSLDFPWLYDYRPLWDIVVITFMAGGTALCITSLILAWRVIGRTWMRRPLS